MQELTLVSCKVFFFNNHFYDKPIKCIDLDRIDFSTTPITLNFTAGGEILLAGNVLIFDDMIDEALEYFVVTLTFQDPANLPPLASIESNGGDIIRIDIIDNDGELKHIIIG